MPATRNSFFAEEKPDKSQWVWVISR